MLFKNAEFATLISNLQNEISARKKIGEFRKKILRESKNCFGRNFRHERAVTALISMQKGWGNTHKEHAAVALLLPWADLNFRLELSNTPK